MNHFNDTVGQVILSVRASVDLDLPEYASMQSHPLQSVG